MICPDLKPTRKQEGAVMRRTVQGLRLMKFEEVYGRTCRGGFRALTEVIAGHGPFCALYAARGRTTGARPRPAARWTGTTRRRSPASSAWI
jgi:hypothetical protein